MAVKYTYSIQSDFPQHAVSPDRLLKEVRDSAVTIALDYINSDATSCDLWFKADLPTADKSLLDSLVAAHSGEPLPDEALAVVLPGTQELDHATLVSLSPRQGTEVVRATHNLCDATTWWEGSTRVESEVLTDSGDGLRWVSQHPVWIDLDHGKIYEEEQIVEEYRPVISVDGVEATDYVIDYQTGDVTFATSKAGQIVTATYNYAVTSTWTLVPYPGKILCVEQAEIQLSADIQMDSPFVLELHGYVDVFAPEMAESNGGPVPNGTKIKLGAAVYKTVAQIIDEAKGSYPPIPPIGGSIGGTQNTFYVFPFVYLATKELRASYGMEYHVYVLGDTVYGGERATATFYCVCRDE